MNNVNLKTEIKSYLINALSSIDGEMGEMVRSFASRGGGLLRPQLAIRSAEVYGVPRNHIMPAAAGLELVHGASLILDDAPFMDNSNMRNGEDSFHVMHEEGRTVLVAQYLTSSIAPELNSKNIYLNAEIKTKIQAESARAANGLCVGQYDDMYHKPETLEEVVELHRKKTGDLFAAAAVVGGIAGNATESELELLRSFGHNLGIAYQMGDDIYDLLGNVERGGKPIHQDGEKVTVFNFKPVHEAVNFWRNWYALARSDLASLSLNLALREKEGNFTGIVNARPLHEILNCIELKQEYIMDIVAA